MARPLSKVLQRRRCPWSSLQVVWMTRGVTGVTVQALLQQPPLTLKAETFAKEQARDSEIREMVDFLRGGKLPDGDQRARYMTLQRSLFTLEDEILYYLDRRQQYCKRAVVPRHLREQTLIDDVRSLFREEYLWSTNPTLMVGWDV